MKIKASWPILKSVFVIPIVVASLALAGSAVPRELHIHDFADGKDGAAPWAGLTQDSSGTLYGTTNNGGKFLYGTVFKLANVAGRWHETILHEFGARHDGILPEGDLLVDRQGDIFGTAGEGGSARQCDSRNAPICGIVFELSTVNGREVETILHEFTGSDGYSPQAGLIADAHGNLYGTTRYGGAFGSLCTIGCGTAFQLTHTRAGWVHKVLYRFASILDGNDVVAPLALDSSGNLFGMTQGGGNGNGCVPENGCGTVFELQRQSRGWREIVLYRFSGQNGDGAWPGGTVNIDAHGNLFGTTGMGGAASAGIFFELERTGTGWKEHVLYTFADGLDGGHPSSTLTPGGDGIFFGTTPAGGLGACNDGCGTVFRLARMPDGSWRHTVLYRFTSYQDGNAPIGRVLIGKYGHILGTNFFGGTHNAGNVFEVAP
jgi:hypothetical protein